MPGSPAARHCETSASPVSAPPGSDSVPRISSARLWPPLPEGLHRSEDIEHVVILMQENRSFDHYFGTYAGVRGFGDKRGLATFHQRGLDGRTVLPWHLTSGCIPDVSHRWTTQHKSWNGGR